MTESFEEPFRRITASETAALDQIRAEVKSLDRKIESSREEADRYEAWASAARHNVEVLLNLQGQYQRIIDSQ